MLYLGDDRVFGKEKRRRVQSETDPADPGQSISTHEIQCGRENSKWVGIKLAIFVVYKVRQIQHILDNLSRLTKSSVDENTLNG